MTWARGTSNEHILSERMEARRGALFKGIDLTPPKAVLDKANDTRRRMHDRDDRRFLREATASGYD